MSIEHAQEFSDIAKQLLSTEHLISALDAPSAVPNTPGYYSIWVDSPSSLLSPFSDLAREREHNLLYIGVASKSLQARLVEQELQHKKAATFFRSVGAALGYRPVQGSLLGKKNTSNYRFSISDTEEIMKWVTNHLLIQFATTEPVKEVESELIRTSRPLFNIQGNPDSLSELSDVRDECRTVALSPA